MTDERTISYYRGKRIDGMTREELISALQSVNAEGEMTRRQLKEIMKGLMK